MRKTRNWLSSLKRLFIANPKDRQFHVANKKIAREKKKWERGKLKDGEASSFFRLQRDPSSIEKMLRDTERENRNLQVLKPERIHQSKPSTPSAPTSSKRHHTQASATKIQAAYRGYMARKNYRVLKSLVRLQDMMKGQAIKQQTMNTLRCMQLLVKVQLQVHSRRIQMMERNLQQQKHQMSEINMDNTFSKGRFIHQSEEERREDWNNRILTKEEIDARTMRKLSTVFKRERTLAYAQSCQIEANAVAETNSNGWNRVENQVQYQHRPDHVQLATTAPTPSNKHQPPQTIPNRYGNAGERDTESLISFPALGVPPPRYMALTVSARAKVRDRPVPGVDCPAKKRFPYGMGQSLIGLMGWGTEKSLKRTPPAGGKHRSSRSVGGESIDSTVSAPARFGSYHR